MSQEPRVWLPDTHARLQKKDILTHKMEALSSNNELLDFEIEELAKKKKKKKPAPKKVVPKSSSKKNKGNECHDPQTGKFCKGTKKAGSIVGSFKKVPPTITEYIDPSDPTKEGFMEFKAQYEMIAEDGAKLTIKDLEGSASPEQAKTWLEALAANHKMNPMKPPATIIILPEHEEGTYAFVFKAPSLANTMFLNYKEMGGKDYNKPFDLDDSNRNHFMDVAKPPTSVTRAQYVITHEYGHTFDFSTNRNSAKGLYDSMKSEGERIRDRDTYDSYVKTTWHSFSHYGSENNEIEAYAEAFTEWNLSGGKTSNKAARAYAIYEKWPGWQKAEAPKPVSISARPKSGPAKAAFSEERVEMASETPNSKLPFDGPVVIDNFKTGKSKAIGITLREPTSEEIAEAEKALKAVEDK